MLLQELYLKTRAMLTQNLDWLSKFFPRHIHQKSLTSLNQQSEHWKLFRFSLKVRGSYKSHRHHPQCSVLLATICGVLSANDVSIFDAQIYTREDGFVIDSFRVVDAATKIMLTAAQQSMIVRDMENVLTQQETLEKLFDRHHRRWKRRANR